MSESMNMMYSDQVSPTRVDDPFLASANQSATYSPFSKYFIPTVKWTVRRTQKLKPINWPPHFLHRLLAISIRLLIVRINNNSDFPSEGQHFRSAYLGFRTLFFWKDRIGSHPLVYVIVTFHYWNRFCLGIFSSLSLLLVSTSPVRISVATIDHSERYTVG